LPVAWLCSVLLLTSCAPERTIGISQSIHHDDFEYRVDHFTVTDALGSGAGQKKAKGRFYVVAFAVQNLARRVNHDWDNTIAYIVDDRGNQHENEPEAQTALNSIQPFNLADKHRTPAGVTENTILVFDVPAECAHPHLMVRGDLLMGDTFDGMAFAKTRIRLF
jgi:hypothetical protein